jgi:glycosyltransferase involved in cell wall biosynthesis
MHILLVTNYYPPEIGGAVHRRYELARSLKARGHEVTVLTGYPCYNVKDVPAQYRRGLWLNETLDGICVRRIRIPSLPRASKIARGLEHFIVGLWLSGLTSLGRRADVALVGSPPLPLPWLVSLVGRARRLPVTSTRKRGQHVSN